MWPFVDSYTSSVCVYVQTPKLKCVARECVYVCMCEWNTHTLIFFFSLTCTGVCMYVLNLFYVCAHVLFTYMERYHIWDDDIVSMSVYMRVWMYIETYKITMSFNKTPFVLICVLCFLSFIVSFSLLYVFTVNEVRICIQSTKGDKSTGQKSKKKITLQFQH